MNCERWQDLLLDELYGELEPAGRRALLAHLAGCPRCRDEREALARTLSLVRAAPAGPGPSSDPSALLAAADRAAARWRVRETFGARVLAAVRTLVLRPAAVAGAMAAVTAAGLALLLAHPPGGIDVAGWWRERPGEPRSSPPVPATGGAGPAAGRTDSAAGRAGSEAGRTGPATGPSDSATGRAGPAIGPTDPATGPAGSGAGRTDPATGPAGPEAGRTGPATGRTGPAGEPAPSLPAAPGAVAATNGLAAPATAEAVREPSIGGSVAAPPAREKTSASRGGPRLMRATESSPEAAGGSPGPMACGSSSPGSEPARAFLPAPSPAMAPRCDAAASPASAADEDPAKALAAKASRADTRANPGAPIDASERRAGGVEATVTNALAPAPVAEGGAAAEPTTGAPPPAAREAQSRASKAAAVEDLANGVGASPTKASVLAPRAASTPAVDRRDDRAEAIATKVPALVSLAVPDAAAAESAVERTADEAEAAEAEAAPNAPAAERLFAAGERARLAGRSDEALSLYLRVAADHPAHPRAAQALLAAVRLRHDHGDLAGARSLAARLEADYRGTPAAAEARRVVDSPRPAVVPSGAR